MTSLKDLDVVSIRNMDDARKQANIGKKILKERIEEYWKTAPESIKKLENYGVPKEAVVGGGGTAIGLFGLFILVAYGAQILSVFVTVIQPLYYTWKALETDTKDDDTVLLTYWFVHGVLYLAESTIMLPLVSLIGGIYFLAKMAFLFWMLNFEGSMIVYNKLLAPTFRKHEAQVENVLDTVKKEALGLVNVNIANKDI